ncbi:ABC transporter permease subunit [Anaeromicropila herbilytica]|uniref:ABC transporter permease n=1 Tax=Anaeromicropila herbilytica TaxID=2785025 RepID=A0A7R7EGP6_9FIRM|nr:ABC transporter permease subunit [Anaeromicropila herbilytica]BCN28870.1 hypothetical protein bsdtb5_01650 [Anaeromicropila herbilytica]
MSRLIQMELYKFMKQRKNQIILAGLFLFFLGVVIYYSYEQRQYDFNMRSEMESEYYNASAVVDSLSLKKDRLEKGTKEEVEEIKRTSPDFYEEYDFWMNEKDTSFKLFYYYKNRKVKGAEYCKKIEVEKYKNLLIGWEKGFMSKDQLISRGQEPTELERQIRINQYLLKNKLHIVDNPYQLTGVNFLFLMLKGYMPMILLVIIILLCMDIFLSEMEEGSYKLYLTQPFSRRKAFLSKIFVAGITSIGSVVVLLFAFFGITSILNGVGSMKYPQTMTEGKMLLSLTPDSNLLGKLDITTTGKYLMLGYLLLALVIITTVMVTIYISVLTDSTSITIGVITALLLLGFVLSSFLDTTISLHAFYPLTYINVYSVLNAQVNAPLLLGLVVNGLIVFVALILSYQRFCKKDLLGGC